MKRFLAVFYCLWQKSPPEKYVGVKKIAAFFGISGGAAFFGISGGRKKRWKFKIDQGNLRSFKAAGKSIFF
jgi:hypothetical protein